MGQQIPLDPAARMDSSERDAERHDHTHEIAPDLAYRRLALVNVVFFADRGRAIAPGC